MRRFALLLLLGSAGCRSTAFEVASRADSPEAYRTFLREHPRDENVEAALARLADLELAEAAKVHTVVAYKRFLEEFPDSAQAAAARARLEGLRFNAAKERGTAGALRDFLRDHSDGSHREEAERLLATAQRAELPGIASPERLLRLAAEGAGTPLGAEAQARLDQHSFGAAKSAGAEALLSYLRDFPAGAHREEAQALLLSHKLEGLLFSDLVDEARALAKSPLAALVPDLETRLQKAEARRRALASPEPLARSSQAGHYLRDVADLERSLAAPDALDRWEAAEELGQQISVLSVDPLLRALRSSRSALVRRRAFESLGSVLGSLPPEVADYEVAVRLEAWRPTAEGAEVHLVVAALLDLSGRLEEAATEYQKSFDRSLPDPLVLWRWAQIRAGRGQHFSAAVAARQLARWALEVARAEGSPAPATALWSARQLCAASEAARFAVRTVAEARRQPTEFPDDLAEFAVAAQEAAQLAEAKLKDAELVLRTGDSRARTCADREVAGRIADGERARAEALRQLLAKLPKLAPALLEAARDRDPSTSIRALAASMLQASRGSNVEGRVPR